MCVCKHKPTHMLFLNHSINRHPHRVCALLIQHLLANILPKIGEWKFEKEGKILELCSLHCHPQLSTQSHLTENKPEIPLPSHPDQLCCGISHATVVYVFPKIESIAFCTCWLEGVWVNQTNYYAIESIWMCRSRELNLRAYNPHNTKPTYMYTIAFV